MITVNYYRLVNGKHWDAGTSLGDQVTATSIFSKTFSVAMHVTGAVVKTSKASIKISEVTRRACSGHVLLTCSHPGQ